MIKKLLVNGYKRESVVYNTSDFSVRGFVIDIFPINEENPIRIEFFDNQIEKIKYFDIVSQKSNKEINEITVGTIKDDFGNNNSSLREFIDDNIVVFNNINQIKEQEKMILPQIKYLNIENEIYKLSDLIKKDDMYFDTINNRNCDLVINATSIEKYNLDKKKFVEDIIKTNGVLYAKDNKIINDLKLINKNIKIKKDTLNHGFVYKNNYYYSEYDLIDNYKKNEKRLSFNTI